MVEQIDDGFRYFRIREPKPEVTCGTHKSAKLLSPTRSLAFGWELHEVELTLQSEQSRFRSSLSLIRSSRISLAQLSCSPRAPSGLFSCARRVSRLSLQLYFEARQ